MKVQHQRLALAALVLLTRSTPARAQSEPAPVSVPPPPPATPGVVVPSGSPEGPPALARPPLVLYVAPAPPPVRAPMVALWVGGRAGVLAYGGGLYLNHGMTGNVETTGNFVQSGLALELDVGARIARRYIPYVALEVGLMGSGHRFDRTNASASTTFAGAGLRYLAGDPNTLSFLGDVSFGLRRLQVSRAGTTWSTTGLEIFRLGFGIEARLTNHLTVSPAITLSGGTFTSTSGAVSFGADQGDGVVGPPFVHGTAISQADQTSYYAVVIGCGVHADLFGK